MFLSWPLDRARPMIVRGPGATPGRAPPGRAPTSRRPTVLSVSPRRRCGRGRAGGAARTGVGRHACSLTPPHFLRQWSWEEDARPPQAGRRGARRGRTALHEQWSAG